MDELSGKVAVVTGAASGIGLGMARAFAAEGMKVVLADIEEGALDEAASGFGDDAEVEAVRCDVSDGASVEALRDVALDRFGAVHVVCNNAGVSAGGPIWEQSVEDWEWVLGVNLWGVIHGVRTFTPLLLEQGEGHIVNTASMAGLTSPPFMGVYNVTKHAVVTLSETLFADLAMAGATSVGVSVLCPGWVRTRIHESGRNRPGLAEAQGGVRLAEAETVADGSLGGQDPAMREFIDSVIAGGLDPADVAATVVKAVQDRRFYILTHPEWNPMISGRIERIVAGEDPAAGNYPI
ncbi:MAG: SDR family NAD(P)-dependent oxidoreductase [Acidimicrobiales bacterium]